MLKKFVKTNIKKRTFNTRQKFVKLLSQLIPGEHDNELDCIVTKTKGNICEPKVEFMVLNSYLSTAVLLYGRKTVRHGYHIPIMHEWDIWDCVDDDTRRIKVNEFPGSVSVILPQTKEVQLLCDIFTSKQALENIADVIEKGDVYAVIMAYKVDRT